MGFATDKIMLAAALCPYLGLALYDGWLHEKARRVPMPEQVFHATIALSLSALLFGLFTDRPLVARLALAVFVVAALIDEFRFHGPLAQFERRLHFLAYTCFAGFIGVAIWLGMLR